MVRDMRNTRPEKQSLTPMQKQAVLVCSVCALAAILTIAITMTLLKRGKTPAAPGEQPSSEVLVPGEEDISDHYQISETSAALLPETADAGESYQKETLFLGDSNTVRLYANGLISLQQFCAKEGIGTHAALNEGIVTFKKDSSTYTIAQAVAKMKPRRVVIMLKNQPERPEKSADKPQGEKPSRSRRSRRRGPRKPVNPAENQTANEPQETVAAPESPAAVDVLGVEE